MFQLKSVVITGAGSGIGKALTEMFLEQGAIVWALDKAEASLIPLVQAAHKAGKTVHSVVADVTDRSALESAAAQVKAKHGSLDIWVNNAGVAGLGAFQELSNEQFEKVIAINLNAVVAGTRIALQQMEKQGAGTIVNVASVAGHIPSAFMTAYCTSKHAVVGFTRSLTEELRLSRSGVKLCLVSPGFVDTAILAKGQRMGFPAWLQWLLATPEGVAREVIRGIQEGREEVFPTRNGRWMLHVNKVLPRVTRRGAKVLMAKSFSDLVTNRYRV